MTDESLRDHPLGTASPVARLGRWPANGTSLYAEVRGSGPAILLMPGGAEDAEGWRPVAERLSGHTVVTYDRRGTLRSGREDWPGRGSVQHADDAAALLRALALGEVTVFGGSSAGIIALQMAIRHPGLVRLALVYEPGTFGVVPHGAAFREPVDRAVQTYLEDHPTDWVGAYAAFQRTAASAIVRPSAQARLLATPSGMEWFAGRESANAEPFVRDDLPFLTNETPDEAALAASDIGVRFSYGTRSVNLFREIAEHLAAVRGDMPDTIEGVGHALYIHPEEAAAYIRAADGRA